MSWFPFYVDDFLGGTSHMTDAEVGRYVLCLIAQWSSGEQAAILGGEQSLKAMCRGNDPGPVVLEKFAQVDGSSPKRLRNKRLYDEWVKAKREHDGKANGGKRAAKQVGQLPTKPPHNPQPTVTEIKAPSEPVADEPPLGQLTSTPAGEEPVRASKGRETWLTPYGSAWRERWGEESEPPWGELARELQGPHNKLGVADLAARWRRFLAAAERPEWARPARFRQGLGQWTQERTSGTALAKNGPVLPGRQSVGERQMDAAARFLARKGGGS